MTEDIDKKDLLKRTVSRVLRPLVRLMIGNGLGYREFCDIARISYYDTGRALLTEQQEKINGSRLAVLTGLNRKEISHLDDIRFRNDGHVLTAPKPRSPSAAVIGTWVSDPRFLDENENPLPLPYSLEDPQALSFVHLVESVSKDMRARAYLDELQRLDLVTITDGPPMTVTLKQDAFLPTADFTEKLSFFTSNVHDHMAAAMANIEGRTPPFFERSAYHDALSTQDILALQKILRVKGMRFLKKMYHETEERSKRTEPDSPKNQRMTLGLYFYAEDSTRDDL